MQATTGIDRASQRPFHSFSDQLAAVIVASEPAGATDPRLLHLNRIRAAATGMSQGDPSSGGYAVAPTFSQMIWDGLAGLAGNLLPLTDQYPVEGESLTHNANAETSRATGSRYGAIRSYWISEADQITHSKPKVRQVKLEPQELAVLVYVTDRLRRPGGRALEQYVTKAATREIAFMTSAAIVSGTGAGTPLGLLNSTSLVTVSKESGQGAATILPENVSKMWARMHPDARHDAIWLHNADIEPQLDAFNKITKNVAGTENVGGYEPKVYDAEKRTIKGRPLVAAEFCETLGTKGDLTLWSPSSYVVGVRAEIDTQLSLHVRFDYAESAFRFIFGIDGQPWLASALTPFKGTDTLTTHVALETRS